MQKQREIIIRFLSRNGPSLPVEVGKELGYNSLLTKAVLIELIDDGVIRQSKRPIGNSLLYYLPGQEGLVKKELFNDLSIPERHALKRLKQEDRSLSEIELTPQERFIIKSLLDFIDVKLINNQKYYSLKGVEQRVAPIIPKPVTLFAHKPVPEPEPAPGRPVRIRSSWSEEVKSNTGFDNEVTNYLERLGQVKVLKVVRRNRETNYVLKMNEPFPQTFFIKSKNKKRINESDLSLIYTETLKQRMPGLLVTKGDLTSTAKKWMKDNVGDLIKLIRIK